jgi:polysaccharide export outer membrane protein
MAVEGMILQRESRMARGVAPIVLALTLGLAACASTPMSEKASIGKPLPPPDTAQIEVSGATTYHVGPMDVLDITVFQVPDLTRTVQVDAAGQITLPLIGQISAAGKTVGELQTDIANRLQAKYLQSPDVTVFVKEYTSQKVTVDGSVNQPGVYAIAGKTSLLQAVAMARGTAQDANTKRAVIFRTINSERMAAVFDLDQIRAGRMDDPEIYGNDVVVIDHSGVKGVLRNLTGAVPLMTIFRPAAGF